MAASAISDTEIINNLLNKGYDWRVRPPGTNLTLPGSHGPVVVSVNMLIRSISKIDDVNMEYSVQLTFRESWVDGRLAYGLPRDNKPDFLILTAGQQIWMPDSFFQNEKQAQKHMIDKPNVLIRVHKDGQILYSVRISLVLSCPMHLHNYPLDTQTCLIDLASYAYTMDDIEYRWKETDPVQLKPGLESSLPSFQLQNSSTTYCTSKTNTGTYSCLRTVLTLQRQFSYYLLQLYIPSSVSVLHKTIFSHIKPFQMLVIVSWVSFWLDRNAVPARVTLGVTTLLTITTQASGINAKLPPVSYVKAVDLWIGACMTFIFSALLEFAAVTYISSRKFYKSSAQKSSTTGNVLLTTHPMANTPLLMPPLGTQTTGGSGSDEVWVKQRPSAPNQVMVVRTPAHGVSDVHGVPSVGVMMVGNEIDPSILHPRKEKASTLGNFLKSLPPFSYILRHMELADSAKKVDYVSRFLFPLCFITFNIAYWSKFGR